MKKPFAIGELHTLLTTVQRDGNPALLNCVQTLEPWQQFAGLVHNNPEIAETCAQTFGGADFPAIVESLWVPKLSATQIDHIVAFAAARPHWTPALAEAVGKRALFDPEANQISLVVSRIKGIKIARLLYFIVPFAECWPAMEVALKADTERTAAKAWQKLTRGQYDSTNFCWNIQSTVARVMLLALKFQGAETLAVWMRFLEQNLDMGHDGKATGFNKATLKLVS